MLTDLPPIHFGRADGLERTLLRVACQSEIFLAPPWHGGIDIRVLWHIGCQSDFDELVLMSFRPVYRGFCRRRCFSTPFHPVKGGFLPDGRDKSAVSSGERWVCPDGKSLNAVSSTEKAVSPDGKHRLSRTATKKYRLNRFSRYFMV